MTPIFSKTILDRYLPDFKLSSVTGIREITAQIKELVNELEAGKIEALKEEEIKSRFISTFFGDVLGFNYGNSTKWQLREEKKSIVDGTKPDGALGYFFIDQTKDDVRAIIEIKDAKTDLDKKQNRDIKQSPVDQAFGYASKAGGQCKWVILSNIKEIRFYPSLDRSKCQVYLLKDLLNEYKLKELLFLFHKDRFIHRETQSPTDKLFSQLKLISVENKQPVHIIDKIYNSLKRFEGFGFVDPNYISTIFPFNILNEHVWQYNDRNLFTINSDIYDLLLGINIKNEKLEFSSKLNAETKKANVIDAKHKMEWVFTFLNHCLIYKISAIKDYKQVELRNKNTIGFSIRHSFQFNEGKEGLTKNILLNKNKTCDCISCNYRKLDFNKILNKLKSGEGNQNLYNAEYAYGNYLVATNNFKSSYNIYKTIEKELKGKEGKGVQYFLTKQNIKRLHNLALDYQFLDSIEMMNDIKSIDLDKVIYDEIEFDVDKEVKKYLIDIKEQVLVYKLQDEIEEITFKIDKLRLLYENGGTQTMGPNLANNLAQEYYLLYAHINRNYIIYDIFRRYKSLTEKVFRGLVTSYNIQGISLTSFNDFFLTEAILHITPSELQEILKGTNNLKVEDGCIEKLLEKLDNLTTFTFKKGLFSEPYENSLFTEQLKNYKFQDRFNNIFSNLFTILSRLDISINQFEKSKNSLLNFLKIEDNLFWFHLKEFSFFLLKKGDLFEPKELMEILKISINKDNYGNNKYSDLVNKTPKVITRFYPNYRIDNLKIVQTAILNCTSDNGKNNNYKLLVNLTLVCNDECKKILFDTFEKALDKNFSADLYEELLRSLDYDYTTNNYFRLYSEQVNLNKSRSYKFGKNELTTIVFINYILIIYKSQIDFHHAELKLFTDLNDFEKWLLNPFDFNYQKFDAKWLLDISNSIILDRMRTIDDIALKIEFELKKEFLPTLAEIKYKYFNSVNI